MLFGNYERNSGTAQAIWKLWDEVAIEARAMVGWWEDDAPVQARPPPPAPGNASSCHGSFQHTVGSFISSPGGPSGVIGFGAECGAEAGNEKYPKLTVAEAKATCCDLGAGCVGFSFATAGLPAGAASTGCFEKAKGGMAHSQGVDGYERQGGAGAQCSEGDIKATSYVDYGVSALVVIASWCEADTNVTLQVDWGALGLDAAKATVTQPGVPGVQPAGNHGGGKGSFVIKGSGTDNGGVILLIE